MINAYSVKALLRIYPPEKYTWFSKDNTLNPDKYYSVASVYPFLLKTCLEIEEVNIIEE